MKKTNIYFWLFFLSPAIGYLVLQSVVMRIAWNYIPYNENFDSLSLGMCILLPIVAGGYYLAERGKRRKKEVEVRKSGEMILLILMSGIGLSLMTGFFFNKNAVWEIIPAFAIFVSVIVVPINEEIIYRGMVLRRAEEGFGRMTAVIVSAVVFGVAHAGTGRMLMAVFAGFLFGLVAERFGTIWASIPLHMLVNVAVLWDRLYELPIFIYVAGFIMALIPAVIMSSELRQNCNRQ